MTEQDWLISTDPTAMLSWLSGDAIYAGFFAGITRACVNRKRALFADAAACSRCRPEIERLIEERFACAFCQPPAAQANLLRDIFGNPFRPRDFLRCGHVDCFDVGDQLEAYCRSSPYAQWLRWRDGLIPAMARRIYDEQRFDELPILGDALEEAGCDSAEILRHCRNQIRAPGDWYKCGRCGVVFPYINKYSDCDSLGCEGERCDLVTFWVPSYALHVRGCWVIDLLLSKG